MTAENWTPIRFVRVDVWCCLCFRTIPAGSPGSTTGSRGTRAYWLKESNIWLCLGCREETTRDELKVNRCPAICPSHGADTPWSGSRWELGGTGCIGLCRLVDS